MVNVKKLRGVDKSAMSVYARSIQKIWRCPMKRETVRNLLAESEFAIEDVIDAVIQLNGIVGVGRISLGDALKNYCYHQAKDYSKTESEPGQIITQGDPTIGFLDHKWKGGEWQSNHRNGTT
jgi:hypothetical protein